MHYELQFTGAAATIGYLSCQPKNPITEAEAVSYLSDHPLDEHMHKYLLARILRMPADTVQQFANTYASAPVLPALLAEASLQRDELSNIPTEQVTRSSSPLVDLAQERFADMDLHRRWSSIFARNLFYHAEIPPPGSCPPLPYTREEIERSTATFVPVTRFIREGRQQQASDQRSSQQASRRAKEALAAAGVQLGQQMLHQNSLAPVGLVRDWRIEVAIKNGSLDYSLSGMQTSFGRGMVFDTAQAGLLMEICERCSSWAAIGPEGPLGYKNPIPLIKARYSSLGEEAIPPSDMPLEIPVDDFALHWLPGVRADNTRVLVPAQFVFLFSNLDELALCSAIGSTGLGAGLDMHRARVTALLEVIERDAETVMPFDPARCFRLQAQDTDQAALLADYAKRGIEVFFEDITPELGVPCYRAFIIGPEGQVIKGASADLNGSRACLSAMLEVPYPYPWGPASRPAPEALPIRILGELPNYATGSFAGDLSLLESALTASGRAPVYVDLTRSDMQIPVCRAIIPKMELMADFDRNSRLSPRLFANMQKMAEK